MHEAPLGIGRTTGDEIVQGDDVPPDRQLDAPLDPVHRLHDLPGKIPQPGIALENGVNRHPQAGGVCKNTGIQLGKLYPFREGSTVLERPAGNQHTQVVLLRLDVGDQLVGHVPLRVAGKLLKSAGEQVDLALVALHRAVGDCPRADQLVEGIVVLDRGRGEPGWNSDMPELHPTRKHFVQPDPL